jgi:hypothetical protein
MLEVVQTGSSFDAYVNRFFVIAALLLTGATIAGCEPETSFDKFNKCVAEQKKLFGSRYSEGDAVPCYDKYLFNSKSANPYLQDEK